jgi:hypothetical protein
MRPPLALVPLKLQIAPAFHRLGELKEPFIKIEKQHVAAAAAGQPHRGESQPGGVGPGSLVVSRVIGCASGARCAPSISPHIRTPHTTGIKNVAVVIQPKQSMGVVHVHLHRHAPVAHQLRCVGMNHHPFSHSGDTGWFEFGHLQSGVADRMQAEGRPLASAAAMALRKRSMAREYSART